MSDEFAENLEAAIVPYRRRAEDPSRHRIPSQYRGLRKLNDLNLS